MGWGFYNGLIVCQGHVVGARRRGKTRGKPAAAVPRLLALELVPCVGRWKRRARRRRERVLCFSLASCAAFSPLQYAPAVDGLPTAPPIPHPPTPLRRGEKARKGFDGNMWRPFRASSPLGGPRVWVVENAGRGGGERGFCGFRWGHAPPSRPYERVLVGGGRWNGQETVHSGGML